jgi:hypothetical protein
MNTKILAAMILCLFMAGQVLSSAPVNSSQNQWITKGYVTIGRNVVVLPERLQTGDRIEIFNINGKKGFEQFVGSGYLAARLSKMPLGIYTVVVQRDKRIITSLTTPLAGMAGR